jgi:hypothetical protein
MQTTMAERSGSRLLIAAGAAAATEDEAPPHIRSLIENASEVLLITPVLTSKLHVWTDDFDNARHEADERLATILGQLETFAPDSHVSAQSGSNIPLTAFDDAVRTFRPDHILIALRPAEQAAWQEEHLVDQVKQRFQIPTTVFEVDRARDTPPVSTVRSGARHAMNLYRRTLRGALRPIRKVEAETHHLHEVERAGEAGDTPFIAILGIFLFLLPIFGLILGLAFAAFYLVA